MVCSYSLLMVVCTNQSILLAIEGYTNRDLQGWSTNKSMQSGIIIDLCSYIYYMPVKGEN
jgi:hypothetical protein